MKVLIIQKGKVGKGHQTDSTYFGVQKNIFSFLLVNMWLEVSTRKPDKGSLCNKNLLSNLKQILNYLLPKIEVGSTKVDYFIFLLHAFCCVYLLYLCISIPL